MPRWTDTDSMACGRSHILDVMVSFITADSYIEASSHEAGAAAGLSASEQGGQVC